MNMKKIKSFVKSHKTEIAIGAGIVVGTVLFVLTKKSDLLRKKPMFPAMEFEDIDIPKDFMVGEISELWKKDEYINAIVNNITTADLGKLGAEFVNKGIVADGTEVSMVVGFLNVE